MTIFDMNSGGVIHVIFINKDAIIYEFQIPKMIIFRNDDFIQYNEWKNKLHQN